MKTIVTLAQTYRTLSCDTEIGRHYEGCEVDHTWCLVVKLADEVERLTAERDEARDERDAVQRERERVQDLLWLRDREL